MKVTPKVSPNAGPASQTAGAEKASKGSGPEALLDTKSKGVSSADLASSSKVEMSSRARDIARAKEIAMNSSPDIDEAKVARLQSLIDKGQYKVNAEAVADRLLDEHSKMPE